MSYALNIRGVGTTVTTAGYITNLKSILVGGSSSAEIERKLGYAPGSLKDGYWLLVLAQSSIIQTKDVSANRMKDDFEFRGYTHFEDGIPSGEDINVHESLERKLSSNAIDQSTFRRKVEQAAAKLNRGGVERVAKVYPLNPAAKAGYEPGSGVVQFKLTEPKSFDVVAKVEAGESLKREPNGKISTQA
ncbi:MAG: hypothetical protein AAF822_04745 [Pseudomonadota bacterium]